MTRIVFNTLDVAIDLPILATNKFLRTKSNEFGWFISTNFVLPFFIEKKIIFKRMVFSSSTINYMQNEDESEEDFLDSVVELTKKMNVDFIYQPLTCAIFQTFPKGATFCKAQTYQVDLTHSVDDLFKNLHTKHRNVIKKAQKDNVEILSGVEVKTECFEIINETMKRQNKPCISINQVLEYEEKLGSDVSFYIAKKDNLIQGSAIFIWNKNHVSYYFHGGSINNPSTGAINLLQWQAMCDMKEKGVKIFDFVGGRVSPKPGSKQEGIQRFKSRFGAQAKVGYLWKYPVKPFKYFLFRLFAHLNALRHGRRYLGDIIDEEINNAKI